MRNTPTPSLLLLLVCLFQACFCQDELRGPPKVDDKPKLLDSFIPASMQIIAHLTELMKYDVKPPQDSATTTTTTVKPTPSHKPGVFAPPKPLGPAAFFVKTPPNYDEYLTRLQQPASYVGYFDRYYLPASLGNPGGDVPGLRTFREEEEAARAAEFAGRAFAEVLRLANRIDRDAGGGDDVQVQDFSKDFDDSDFRFELLRQKKVPPTRAYVTLLTLYDMLNKESKRLALNKYQGYTDSVLRDLHDASTGTSAFQLRTVLDKMVQRRDITKPEIVKKINSLIKDLDEDNSYINQALRYIPPLPFVL